MESSSVLTLPEEISIANVSEWKTKLGDFLDEASPQALDAEELARVDTAALQLFVAFMRSAKNKEKSCNWKNPSNSLLNTADQLGLKEVLAL